MRKVIVNSKIEVMILKKEENADLVIIDDQNAKKHASICSFLLLER